jgi:hypothetical protein
MDNRTLIILIHRGSSAEMRQFARQVILEHAPSALEFTPDVFLIRLDSVDVVKERLGALVPDAGYIHISPTSDVFGHYDRQIHERLAALGLKSWGTVLSG